MTYDDMADWLDENIFPSDYGSLEDYAQSISNEFGINMELAMALARPFWEEYLEERFRQESLEAFEEPEKPKPKPKEKPKEVKLTQTQETDIKNVIQNEDLTKREVSIRTLEIVNKPFSLKQFYDETGMIQSTARRELGQAVKRGEIERVSRGVYRRL
jgi:hypothetical protein